ncbi:thiamine biosynthesis/tRNA modification protein ThiI [mine drainage metagenome]|uniref:Thiamine biosynthesis/tRNA modification protein ThiI n=1 Tax=mine drainage metagenome TaxID=410659 RepID=T1DBI4_9ZZZZ
MYMLGEKIALAHDYNGIITGESSGQVSSQTPENLKELSRGMQIPVIRPLIGFDKDEISDLARMIGTFPKNPLGEFCSLFSETPITKIKENELKSDIEMIDFIDEMYAKLTKTKSSKVKIELPTDELYNTTKIPDSALVVDLRSPLEFRYWHYPNSLNMPIQKAEELIESGEAPLEIVFYCKMGLQSAYLTSLAREHGIKSRFFSTDKIKKRKKCGRSNYINDIM